MMTKRRPSVLAVEGLEDRTAPAAGDLDPTFGTGGVVVTDASGPPAGISMRYSDAEAVAVTADGGVVAVGSAINGEQTDFVVARYSSDGRPDPTFGQDGVVRTDFVGGNDDADAVAVLPDGRIVVVGRYAAEPGGGVAGVALARYLTDGRLDPSFGNGGRQTLATHQAGNGGFYVTSIWQIAISSAGRILVPGTYIPTIGVDLGEGEVYGNRLAVAAFTPTGELDTGFGRGGYAVARHPEEDGVTVIPSYQYAAVAVAVDPAGRIVAGGNGSLARWAAARFTADGRPDAGFAGGTGVFFQEMGGLFVQETMTVAAVGFQPGGGIILGGTANKRYLGSAENTYSFAAARLTDPGTLDPGFGQAGFAVPLDGVRRPLGPGYVESLFVAGLAVQSDGRVLLAGYTGRYSPNLIVTPAVSRLTADGRPDPGFGNAGVAMPELPFSASVLGMAVLPDGRIVTAGGTPVGTGNGLILARFLATDAPPVVPPTVPPVVPPTVPPTSPPPVSPPPPPVAPRVPAPAVVPGDAVGRLAVLGAGPRVTTADLTGDGTAEVIGASGPRQPNRLIVLDGATNAVLADFAPFEATFTGGLYVTTGALGGLSVVVAPDQGGGPVVVVYDAAGLAAGRGAAAQTARFFGIEDVNFRGGARPAVGLLNGAPALVVGAGFGGGPRIAVYDGRTLAGTPGRLVPDFFAFEDTLRNGAYVAAGDFTADGASELVFGGGPGGGPRVRVIDGCSLVAAAGTFTTLDGLVQATPAAQLANFFSGDPARRDGVKVAVRDVFGEGRAALATQPGGGGSVSVYKAATVLAGPSAADQTIDPLNGAFVG